MVNSAPSSALQRMIWQLRREFSCSSGAMSNISSSLGEEERQVTARNKEDRLDYLLTIGDKGNDHQPYKQKEVFLWRAPGVANK